MQELLVPSVLVVLIFGAAFFAIFRKLAFPPSVPCPNPEWLDRFAVTRYGPMERLLDEADFAFLASQRGCGPALARKLRAERRKLFRAYLQLLRRDFLRICAALEMQLVHSAEDRPELASALMKQRIAFSLGVLQVQARLALHAFGWSQVDVRGLLGALESLRLELRPMAMAGSTA